MAEFMEVIGHIKRMCGTHKKSCAGCILRTDEGWCLFSTADIGSVPEKWNTKEFAKIEKSMTDWAESHPELKYPSWKEAWKRLFPNAMSIPCPINHFGADLQTVCDGRCEMCKSSPVTAEIAEALGIKPVEANGDA
jgi:hypothetical protein